ncbi:hypothetical protein D3C73_1054090 [compost metagenome]
MHGAALRQQAGGPRAVAELNARLRATLGQRDREQMDVAAFVLGRVIAADDGLPVRRQRRFNGNDFVRGDDAAFDAEIAHQARGPLRVLEFMGIAIEVQDAAFKVIVFDAQFGAHAAQRSAAVLGHADHGADVRRQAARQAFAQEGKAPHPLAPVELRPEQ